MNNYISALEELYHHPQNGQDGVFLAAFLSDCTTFPIFITRVTKNGNKYSAEGLGYKWGYDSSEQPLRYDFSDGGLIRNTTKQFFTWYEVSEHRFAPAGRTVPLPLALQAKCHFLPLQPWPVSYGRTGHDDRDWRFSGISYAISRPHACFLTQVFIPDAFDVYAASRPITYPHFFQEAD